MIAKLRRTPEGGFSLVELLSVIALVGVLLALGVFSLRQFWFVRALHGEQDEIVTQLRNLQERVVAESNPLVFGARFRQGGTATSWTLIRYDPANATGAKCTQYLTVHLDAGVRIQQSMFTNGVGSVADTCAGELGGTRNDFVFFFARGTASPGEVTLIQPALNGRRLKVCVSGITGRVEKRNDGVAC